MIERLKRMFVLVEKIEEESSEEIRRLSAEVQFLEAMSAADGALIAGLKRELEECLGRMFEKGWIAAAVWAGRDDLLADIGSPAYLKEIPR